MAVDLVAFAKTAPKLAEAMVEANAGYASFGATETEGGPVVALVIIVRGEHECRDIQRVCDAVSDSWAAGPADDEED